MRCNRHVSDLSSTVGVCASCLRERLLSLIAAQVEANRRKTEDRRKSDAHHPPPLVFPRSVSPYICRRSDDSSWHNNDRRFYSTPQLGPTFSNQINGSGKKKKKHSSKFSLLSTLFKSSRSERSDLSNPSHHSDPGVARGSLTSSTSSPMSSSSSSSPSWFSSLLSRRKKQSRFEPVPPPIHRLHRHQDRGMSPTNVDRDYDLEDGSESGYSSESSQGWRKSAAAAAANTTPARRRGATVQNRNVSGLAFCLSPLVRASPNSHRSQKDGNLAPLGFSGEMVRKPTKTHLSTVASLGANRSRKLADFGSVKILLPKRSHEYKRKRRKELLGTCLGSCSSRNKVFQAILPRYLRTCRVKFRKMDLSVQKSVELVKGPTCWAHISAI